MKGFSICSGIKHHPRNLLKSQGFYSHVKVHCNLASLLCRFSTTNWPSPCLWCPLLCCSYFSLLQVPFNLPPRVSISSKGVATVMCAEFSQLDHAASGIAARVGFPVLACLMLSYVACSCVACRARFRLLHRRKGEMNPIDRTASQLNRSHIQQQTHTTYSIGS